jgi:murein tripeptide amidase MpaA
MVPAWSRWNEPPSSLWWVLLVALTLVVLRPGPLATDELRAVSPVRYDGHAAVRVRPADDAQRELVRQYTVDLWSDSDEGPVIDVVVSPVGLEALREHDVPLEVLVSDIQAVADAERARLEQVETAKPGDWFAEYKNYAAVDAYLDTLARRHPELVELEQIGTSVEGRRIRALRIDATAGEAKTIVLNGGQHAREWIGVMTTTCVADRLLRGHGTDPRIRGALERHAFAIVPLVNPDGYAYSWETDRYWRKNRQEPHGVDLNRNWPVGFGGNGSSSNKRSQIYRGPHAFSEPETKALRDLVMGQDVVAHIDFHAYGQLILYPWSHTKKPAPHRDRFAALGDAMASAIHATHGKKYKLMTGTDLYTAGGTAPDWTYGDRGAMGFTIELRPSGGKGFVLPPEEIVPTCDESVAAVLALAERL